MNPFQPSKEKISNMNNSKIKRAIENFNLFSYLKKADVPFNLMNDGQEFLAECHNCFREKMWIAATGSRKGLWHCFRCGISGNLFQLMAEIEGITPSQAFKKVVGKKEYKNAKYFNDIIEEKPDTSLPSPRKVEVPINYVSLLGASEKNVGKKYARIRGLSDEDIIKYNLMYAPAEKRLIFPVYYDKVLVGWQGRDVLNREGAPKAITLPSKKTGVGFRKSWFYFGWDRVRKAKFITIAEGPIDAIKGHKINAMAMLGKTMSDVQFKRLLTMPNLKTVFLALDEDAEIEKEDLIRKLSPFFEVRVISFPEGTDMGDWSQDEVYDFAKNANVCKKDSSIIRRLENVFK